MSDLPGSKPSPVEGVGADFPSTTELADLARTDDNFRLGLAAGIARDPILGQKVEDEGLALRDNGTYLDAYGDITGPWRAVIEPALSLRGQDPESEVLRTSAQRVVRETYENLHPPAVSTAQEEEPDQAFSPLEAKDVFIDPEGGEHNLAWWLRPTPERVEWDGDRETDPGILAQSTWAEGPNSSCQLTSMLNAWIVRGVLESDEAQYVQDMLVYHDYYRDESAYWQNASPDPEHNDEEHREFVPLPNTAGHVVNQLIKDEEGEGVRMPLGSEEVSAADAPTRLNELLDEGYILVLGDSHHWQTAFRPRGFPFNRAVIINPLGAQVRRASLEDVVALHHEDRRVIMV